jgi:hypothetical protein
MNWTKKLEGSSYGQIVGIIPTFTWRDLRKPRPTSSQESQNHSQDSIQPPPEYKSEALICNPVCSAEGTKPRKTT